jgi:hypothetical protein
MTSIEQSKVPIRMRPTLRLKSSAPPKPTPAAEPIAAVERAELGTVSKKAQRKIAAATMRRQLTAMFPECFTFKSPKRPLKIKIHEDILAVCPGFDRRTLSDALRSHVSRDGCAGCLTEGATRVDLQGNAAGVVTEEQVQKKERSNIARRP